MNSKTQIIVMGAMGRMGQMILQASKNYPELEIIGAVEIVGSPYIGKKTGIIGIDVDVSENLMDVIIKGSVIIDFTAPAATLVNLENAGAAGAGMVIGTTGFEEKDKTLIRKAASSIPVLLSPNMSMGVNICFKISELVAKSLKNRFDVEIIEAHHHLKKDAPSGTALGLAEAVAQGTKVNLQDVAIYGREGKKGERPQGEIGIHSVRGGDIVGDHTVLFAGEGERIEIKHMAHSRSTFANGALAAAQFLSAKKTGFFTMADVLGLE